jgi:hypothetical protein
VRAARLVLAGVLTLLGASAAVAQRPASGRASGATRPRNPPPTVPRVVRGACPGEGCEFGPWLTCTELVARAADAASAPPVFTLRPGDSVTALTGNIHVERAGLVTFMRTVRIRDENDPPDSPGRVFTPADTVYPLYYGTEGYGAFYFRGREEGGVWFFPDSSAAGTPTPDGVLLVRPHRERWWVQVRNSRGEVGWVDASWTPPEVAPTFVGVAPHYEDYPPRCPAGR